MDDQKIKKTGIIAWFAKNHVAANILMIFILFAGALTLSTLNRETFPSIDPRMITVKVAYPGATPEDVEEGITRRVEEALIGIQGIKRVESNATEGMGVITAELEDFVDDTEVYNDIKTEVDSLNQFPPENAEQVLIVKAKAVSPVMSLVLYGDVEEEVLRDWAELVEDELLQLPSVTLTNINGSRRREISIEVREEELRKHNLSLEEVARQIKGFSIDIPAGTLRTQSSEKLIRVQDKRYRGNEFRDIPIQSKLDGSILRLSEIAEIRDDFEDQKLINQFEGQNAIFIDVNRSASQDVLEIADEIKEYISEIKFPAGINFQVLKDQTYILKDRMSLMARNALLGLALVFSALVIFLDLKLAFWTSVGIAISFLGGLFLASAFGVTLNMVSLFALIVVLGIVVDDTIVAGESIFSEQEAGKKDMDATLSGVSKVFAPVSVGVFTTIAAFAPLLFSTGTLGQILRPIPIIVIGILIVSLLEAYFILPAHLATSSRWSLGLLSEIRNFVSRKLGEFIDQRVVPFAHRALKFRKITSAIVLVIVSIPFVLVFIGQMKFVFFPQIESDELTVNLEMPVGTTFEVTRENAQKIMLAAEKIRQEFDEENQAKYGNSIFKNTTLTVGTVRQDPNGPHGASAATIASHQAQIEILLVPSDQRIFGASDIERAWQKEVGRLPGARKIAFESSLVRSGEDLNLQLAHRDNEYLEDAARFLKERMESIEGVYEVVESTEQGKTEFVYKVNNTGLASGLTPAQIGLELRAAFYGLEVQRIQRGRNEIKVMVRYPQEDRDSLSILDKIRVKLPNGERATLSAMTERTTQKSYSSIKRVNGRRVIQVTADTDEKVITPGQAITVINESIIPDLEARFPGISHSLEGKTKDQRKDLETLRKNQLIALVLIFVLLSSQLRSYSKPLVIIATVPLGIAGAIYGHFLFGHNLSFISLFGMVALSGVVINDSVVLVDYYNKLLQQGMDHYDAAIEAIRKRFRPIMLTTITTGLGLLPMLLETSLQAQFIIPMAISLACGIFIASAILIFFVPALLLIIVDIKHYFGDLFNKLKTLNIESESNKSFDKEI